MSAARDALANAEMAEATLREEYDTPPAYRPPGHTARVADLHRQIRHDLKVAEIEALIAIGEALGGYKGPVIPARYLDAKSPAPIRLKDGRNGLTPAFCSRHGLNAPCADCEGVKS